MSSPTVRRPHRSTRYRRACAEHLSAFPGPLYLTSPSSSTIHTTSRCSGTTRNVLMRPMRAMTLDADGETSWEACWECKAENFQDLTAALNCRAGQLDLDRIACDTTDSTQGAGAVIMRLQELRHRAHRATGSSDPAGVGTRAAGRDLHADLDAHRIAAGTPATVLLHLHLHPHLTREAAIQLGVRIPIGGPYRPLLEPSRPTPLFLVSEEVAAMIEPGSLVTPALRLDAPLTGLQHELLTQTWTRGTDLPAVVSAVLAATT